MTPEERAEAVSDYLVACERLEQAIIGADGTLEDLCIVAGELHGAADVDTFASVPDLVERAEKLLAGLPEDIVEQCRQCLQVMLSNAWAIERGAF